jgi:hypothetical protein
MKLKSIALIILVLAVILEMLRLHSNEATHRKTNSMIVMLSVSDTSNITISNTLDITIDTNKLQLIKACIFKTTVKNVTQDVLLSRQNDTQSTLTVALCESAIHFMNMQLRDIDSAFVKNRNIFNSQKVLDSLKNGYRERLYENLIKHPDYKPLNYRMIILLLAMIASLFLVFYQPRVKV